MKYKTALKQSINSVKFLSVVVILLSIAGWRWPTWYIGAPAIFMAIYLIFDLINVVAIKRKLRDDPLYLDKKLPGT